MVIPFLMAIWFGIVARKAGHNPWGWAAVGVGIAFALSFVAGLLVSAIFGSVTIDELAQLRITQLVAAVVANLGAGIVFTMTMRPAAGVSSLGAADFGSQRSYAGFFHVPGLGPNFFIILTLLLASFAADITNRLLLELTGTSPSFEGAVIASQAISATAYALLFFVAHWLVRGNAWLIVVWAVTGGGLVILRMYIHEMLVEMPIPITAEAALFWFIGGFVFEGLFLTGLVVATLWRGVRFWTYALAATIAPLINAAFVLVSAPELVTGELILLWLSRTAVTGVLFGGAVYLAIVAHLRLARPSTVAPAADA